MEIYLFKKKKFLDKLLNVPASLIFMTLKPNSNPNDKPPNFDAGMFKEVLLVSLHALHVNNSFIVNSVYCFI